MGDLWWVICVMRGWGGGRGSDEEERKRWMDRPGRGTKDG